jgi:hypothetical protein
MALKQSRVVIHEDNSYYFNSVASRGGVACSTTGGSGVALDNQGSPSSPKPLAAYPASSSGAKPVGILTDDTVSIDTTKYHVDFHKREVDIPGKVNIVSKGVFTTNMIHTGVTTADGEAAYLHSSGLLGNTHNGLANNPRIGTWRSSKDADGYAKIEVNLPF